MKGNKPIQHADVMPSSEHARILAQKNKEYNELLAALNKLKQDSLNLAADYKQRFDTQAVEVTQTKDALRQALEQADDMRKHFEARIEQLNQRHGDTVKQLREELEQAKKMRCQCEAPESHA